MKKYITSASPVFFLAATILFIFWMISKVPETIFSGSPSGWWWFGCLLVGAYLEEIKE